jgi:hypothetical protein
VKRRRTSTIGNTAYLRGLLNMAALAMAFAALGLLLVAIDRLLGAAEAR